MEEARAFCVVLEICGGEGVLRLTGEVDESAKPPLRAAVDEGVAAGCGTLRFDLAGVTFMDIAGVNVLLAARSRLGPGNVVVASPSKQVLRVLRLSGVDRVLTVDVASCEDHPPG